MLSGPSYPPFSGKPARQLVVFLHGLGADGQDLLSLAHEFAHTLPDSAFYAPNAPFPCDMAPYGYQWFSLQEWTEEAMLNGAKQAAGPLTEFLQAELAHLHLTEKDLIVVGFSQGTMMALYTLLRWEKPVAGIIGYSGALIGGAMLKDDIKSRPPVALIHGTADMVVPFDALNHAGQHLKTVGVPVEMHTRPGVGHGIDPGGLDIAKTFLAKAFHTAA